ncbi:hypothetical protein ACLOJK_006403 [Asimina triloba]
MQACPSLSLSSPSVSLSRGDISSTLEVLGKTCSSNRRLARFGRALLLLLLLLLLHKRRKKKQSHLQLGGGDGLMEHHQILPQPDSPSSSTNALRFWEEPIFDHAVFATQNIKPSSSSSNHNYFSCWDADAAITANAATRTQNNGRLPFAAADAQTANGDSVRPG